MKQPVNYNSVAYKLFHRSMFVRIKNNQLYTKEHLRKIPGMSSGNEELDRQFMNDRTAVSRTVVGMAILFYDGVSIEFTKWDDIVNAYNWIKEHLERWAIEIKKPFGLKPPPVEELLILDTFAEHISEVALTEIRRRELYNNQITDLNTTDAFAILQGLMGSGNLGTSLVVNRNYEHDSYKSPIMEAWEHCSWSKLDGNT